MQFQDATFDAIILMHVLNFIKDDIEAITELYRVLKPNGWVVLTVPIYGNKTFENQELDHAGRKKMYGCSDHMRMYGLDLKDKLSNAGFLAKIYSFEDVPGKYVDRNISSPHVQSDRYLFYCIKKI